MNADEIIAKLELLPHPEGGYYRETFRDNSEGERAHSTAILYLLKEGEVSHWHRVDAAEVWHWYAGAPMEISQSDDGEPARVAVLGNDVLNEQSPQIVVPTNVWQSARSLGKWTLVGCTVAPGFEFSGFEMAPVDWSA
jgi:predicted cupin superfamily sugar epimerase